MTFYDLTMQGSIPCQRLETTCRNVGRGWIYSETFKYRDTSAHNIWCITTIDRKVVTAKRLKRTISDRDVLSLGLVSELGTSTDAPVN